MGDVSEDCSAATGSNAVRRAEGSDLESLYFREYSTQVGRAYLVCRSQQLAEDVVSEGFEEIARRWDELDEPGAYLQVSVYRRALSAAERRRPHRPIDAEFLDRTDGSPDPDPLWDLLGTLPVRSRAAVVLKFYERATEQEIAETLECRPGSVGPMVTRALRRLRTELSEEER